MTNQNITSLFALEFKGKLVGAHINSNVDDIAFCNGVPVILDENSNDIWITYSRAIAEKVICKSTPWYKSDMQSPEHGPGMTGNLTIVEFKRC